MTNVTLPRALEPVAAVIALVLAASPALAGGEDRPIRGWLEHAHIEPSKISFDAKLDTGARTSSIHAEILRGPDLRDRDAAQPEEASEAEPEAEGEPEAEEEATAEAAAPSPDPDAGEDEIESGDEIEGGDEIEVVEDESEPAVEEVEVEDGDDERETIVFRVTNQQGESSTLQRTILRYVEIKNGDGTTERRPVVEITACVAGVWVTGEVNLADRDEFNYPFLVGRNMLEASGIIVDSREIYTRSARCPDPAP